MVYQLVKVNGYTLQGAKEILSKKYKALKNKKEIIDSLTSIKSSGRNQKSVVVS